MNGVNNVWIRPPNLNAHADRKHQTKNIYANCFVLILPPNVKQTSRSLYAGVETLTIIKLT